MGEAKFNSNYRPLKVKCLNSRLERTNSLSKLQGELKTTIAGKKYRTFEQVQLQLYRKYDIESPTLR